MARHSKKYFSKRRREERRLDREANRRSYRAHWESSKQPNLLTVLRNLARIFYRKQH